MVDAFSLIALGLVYGATVCSLSCLPYYAPYLMGTGNGFGDGLASSLFFILGKLCSYTALGGTAALIGRMFTFSRPHTVIMGILLLGVALTLPLAARGGCRKRCQVLTKRGSLFILGMVSSLMPCPPLAAIFLLAADNGTVLTGMAYGFFYGLGLIVSPMLILGGGFAPYMQGLAMLIMMIMATNMIVA